MFVREPVSVGEFRQSNQAPLFENQPELMKPETAALLLGAMLER